MKVIKSYWKSCLCFLLTFLCILGCLTLSAATGDYEATVIPNLGTGSSAGANVGILTDASTMYRITAVNIDRDNNEIFSGTDGGSMRTLDSAHRQVLSDGSYAFKGSNWVYVASNQKAFKSGGRTCYYYFGQTGKKYAVHVADGEDTDGNWGTIKSLLGISDLDADAGNLSTALQRMSETTEHTLVRLFDVNPDEFYVIIVEQLRSYGTGRNSNGVYNFVLCSHYDEVGNLLGNGNTYLSRMFHGYTMYQTLPIGGYSSLGSPNSNGFGIFANYAPDGGKKSGANIMVTYTGDTNTSDADKFVSAGTFALAEDGALHTWNGSGWANNFTVNMSTTGSQYSIVKAGAAKLKGNNGNVKISDILAKMNSIGGFNLTWNTARVTGGYFSAGYKTSVATIENDTTVKPIVSRLNGSVTNLKASWGESLNSFTGGNTSIASDTADVVKGVLATAYNKYTDDKALSKNGKLKNGKSVGLGIEFLVRGTPVTSTHYKISLKTDGTATVTKVADMDYTTASSAETKLTDNATCVVIAKKTDANNSSNVIGQNFPDASSPESVLSTLQSRLTDREVATLVAGGETIAVGSTTDNHGYVIYEVTLNSPNLTDPEQPHGKVALEDWFLNKYIDNIIDTSSRNVNNRTTYRLKMDYTDKYNDLTSSDYTTTLCGASLLTHVNQDYNIIYTETSNGTEVSWDDLISKKYYPAASGGTYPSTDSRYKFKPNITIDTKNLNGSTVIDYAFNFVRASVDDVRSFSGISFSSYASLDSDNLLKMRDKFGVVPTVKSTSIGKNQLVGTITENLGLTSKFQYADGVGKRAHWTTHANHVYAHTTVSTDSGDVRVPLYCGPYSYIDRFDNHTCTGLYMNAFPIKKMTYSFDGLVYKYQTANKEEGKNSLLGNNDMKALATNANIPTGATKKNTNEYRYATVHRNAGVDIGFYPENYMAYKIGGTVFDSAPYKYAEVISEAKRTAESSSLYLFKINTDKDSDVITGSTYSDTMQGGTSSMGSTKVSIPAGSDVTVLADTSNIKIDLYGYALDLVNKSKDGTMKTGSNSSLSYGSVVKSNADLNASWGNNASSNSDKLKTNFSSWADKIMDINNFAADFTLSVNNTTKGANFSATIGKVNHTSGATEDGVYNIVVENGKIVEDKGAYTQLIKQIAADYDCSEAEAKQVFTDSQIYTSIMNAIESSNSSSNTSGACTVGAESWTNTLGGNGNWYDEKVRTFVVRRYTNLGNTLSDITATDKLDYGLAPNGSTGKENSSAGTAYDAKWSLSLFFNSAKKADVDKLLLENGTYYDPSTSTEISGANDAHSVLINNTPVSNADFLVPASSTSNFGF